jgi:hypothetical protein
MVQFGRTYMDYRGLIEKILQASLLPSVLCLGQRETEPSRNLTVEV